MDRRQFLTCGVTVALAGCSTNTEENPTQANSSSASPNVTDSQEYILQFGEALNGLNIEVQRLEEQLPAVELAYRTQRQDYQAVSDQIGRISGFYFRAIDQGWSATRLNAETHVEGGEALTWYARGQWYQQYTEGDLTAEELTLQVLETVSRV